MKIDPCPCVISLNDGSVYTLFEFRHFLDWWKIAWAMMPQNG